MEIEAIKKIQTEEIWEMKNNLGKWTGTTGVSITNRLQEIEDRILGTVNPVEEIDTYIKGNVNSKMFLTQNTQEI